MGFTPQIHGLLTRTDGTLVPDWEAEQEHSRNLDAEIEQAQILEQLKLALETQKLTQLHVQQLFIEYRTPESHRNSISRILMKEIGIHGPPGL